MKKILLAGILFLGFVCTGSYAQKFEKLANTPQMGWNSWNKFGCDINEQMIKEMADAIVSSGLKDAGYVYVNLDDCWHGQRDADGFIQCDPKRFPSGIKALSDYVHAKGLKLGIYSDAGRYTCAGKPGSFGHEYQDALQYARWGIDYLKYDWCNNEDINPVGAYGLMRDALHAAGRPILFSMCEWGSNKPWTWAEKVGHSWRTTGDIWCSFDARNDKGGQRGGTVLNILDQQRNLRKYAGPGHWNDPDMLEVGNGMSVNEDRAHFTMWCMLCAPLILGNDIRTMSAETKAILTNRAVIALNQDSLGVQAIYQGKDGDLEFWLKPLVNDEWAFCILNRGTEPVNYTISWPKFNLSDEEVSHRAISFDTTLYSLVDLWSGKKAGTTKAVKKAKPVTIPGHDVLVYRLTPIKK